MLPQLSQPPCIPATLPGLSGLWHSGIDAARVNMIYATAATRAGLPLPDFVAIGRAQEALVRFMHEEHRYVREHALLASPEHRHFYERFAHDVLNRKAAYYSFWVQNIRSRPAMAERWLKRAQGSFRVQPVLQDFMEGLVQMRLVGITERKIQDRVALSSDWAFASLTREAGARTFFGNLFDNGFKYSRPEGGYIQITHPAASSPDEAPLVFLYEDDGIGMDPDFAKELGREGRLREGRAEEVDGDGIGWESMGLVARDLGWRWSIESAIGKGTKVTVTLNEGDLIPVDRAKPIKDFDLSPENLLPTSRFVDGARVFLKASPFAGYQMAPVDGVPMIDVARSPVYGAIERARVVRDYLERHLIVQGAPAARAPW
jgi:Histidine kinase-, DNA gyrase B-, and HSP90-like ATPase